MRTTATQMRNLLAALLLATAVHPEPVAQTTGPKNPPLVIASMSGRDLFGFYCASCHGRDGKGDGPVVSALKTQPPDLTLIAQHYGGTFPTAHVESVVTGSAERVAAAHGSADMPVWGPIFKGLDSNDTVNKLRISNIVGYVESIQAR